MLDRAIIGAIKGWLPFDGQRFAAFSSSERRLLAAAALLHITLALGLFSAGRAEVAPYLIDRDGIVGSFAFDSYDYQRGAVRLAEILREDGVRAWGSAREPLHVKLISVEFVLLGPLFGHSILSAEPLNLLSYLAVVALALALGREVCSPRVGLFSAGAVALWPTFLLHTVQLLKDPLFIAGALTLVLCVTTWLTRTYDPRGAVRLGALMSVITLLVLLIRFNFGIALFALVLLGLVLLVVRQLRERRLLYWNMACPLMLLVASIASMPFYVTHPIQKFKRYPSDQGGQPKSLAGAERQVPALVSYRSRAPIQRSFPLHFAATDNAARRVSSLRSRFAASYPDVGSGIDRDVEFRDLTGLILYLPRAFEIGFWAPFPNTWAAPGQRVGSIGRLLSGAETLLIYVCQLLALLAVLQRPRRLASWLLLSVTTFGMTALGLVVPNVGALYRFRYTFWILLIILSMKGLERVITSSERWLRRRRVEVRATATATLTLLACLLVTACSSAPRADSTGTVTGDASGAQGATPGARPAPDGQAAAALGLSLDNSTGTAFRALYLSPSDSTGWEEDVLGGEGLPDGETVNIRFSPEEKAAIWDLRVEAVDGHFVEWKRLNLHEISTIRLFLRLAGERVVVAEVE